MKFSLRNVLIVISFLAVWLGFILSDGDEKIRARAVHLQEQLILIERAKSFDQPVRPEELRNPLHNELTMK